MFKRRWGLVLLALVGLGLESLAVAPGDGSAGSKVVRPVAVDPVSELPSPEYLALQKNAMAQPLGKRVAGAGPVVPAIARPQR